MLFTRLVVVRIIVFVILVIATYAVGLYVFERYVQLNEDYSTPQAEELNNPRLNHKLLEKINEDFESRKIYNSDDTVDVVIPEKDPFYN